MKRRNEAEEEDVEEETMRDRVWAQPRQGFFFLFAPQLSSGPIKEKKKREKKKGEIWLENRVKNRLRFERSYSNRGLDLMEIFLSNEHCHSRTFRRVEAQYLECRASRRLNLLAACR